MRIDNLYFMTYNSLIFFAVEYIQTLIDSKALKLFRILFSQSSHVNSILYSIEKNHLRVSITSFLKIQEQGGKNGESKESLIA